MSLGQFSLWRAQAGVWTWEAGVKLSRSFSATGCKEGEDRWAAKNASQIRMQQDLWLSLLRALVASTIQPLCSPFGPGNGSTGRCCRHSWMTGTHPHRRKEASKTTRHLWSFWTWPAGRVSWMGIQIQHCVESGREWGNVLDVPRNVIIEILCQASACLSWRAWKSYESAECVSGWGGKHKNNHHHCGRQYIMAGLPRWTVNTIRLCVCFREG